MGGYGDVAQSDNDEQPLEVVSAAEAAMGIDPTAGFDFDVPLGEGF